MSDLFTEHRRRHVRRFWPGVVLGFYVMCVCCMGCGSPVGKTGVRSKSIAPSLEEKNSRWVTPIGKTVLAFGSSQAFFPNGVLSNALSFVDKIKKDHLKPATFVDVHVKSVDGEALCRSLSPLYTDIFVIRPELEELDQLSGLQSIAALRELLGPAESVIAPWQYGAACWQWRVCNGNVGRYFKAFDISAVAQKAGPGMGGIDDRSQEWRIIAVVARESITPPE
jgi:hypothetical protein